jgi:hypothetical protein
MLFREMTKMSCSNTPIVSTFVQRNFGQSSYYDTQVPNKSCTNQISDATWRQKEVVWYHDMLNLNFNLEIVINLVNLDLSWKLMHMGAKVLFKTL